MSLPSKIEYMELARTCNCQVITSDACKKWCKYQKKPTRSENIIYAIVFISVILIGLIIPYMVNRVWGYTSVPYFASSSLSLIFLCIFTVASWYFTRHPSNFLPLLYGGAWIVGAFTLGEFFGWYTRMWNYMLDENDPIIVLQHTFAEAWTVFFVMLPIGLLYLFFAQMHSNHGTYFSALVIGFIISFGWSVDIFINGFDSYIVTFFVWTIMAIIYWTIVYFTAQKISAKKI